MAQHRPHPTAAPQYSPTWPTSLIVLINCKGGQLPSSSFPGGTGASAQCVRAGARLEKTPWCFWQERSVDGHCSRLCSSTYPKSPWKAQCCTGANTDTGQQWGSSAKTRQRQQTCTASSAPLIKQPRRYLILNCSSCCEQLFTGRIQSRGFVTL